MRARPIVAIDGPAGAGKSTAARRTAESLGFVLVDTGALYRGVALIAKERGVDLGDSEGVAEVARSLDLRFLSAADQEPRLWIDGEDRSEAIRSPEISGSASVVSAHGAVRDALLDLQRRLGQAGGVVLEGRDIGTVVFPDAEVKIYLTASDEERARRRVDDLRTRGFEADPEVVLREIRDRDRRDRERDVAPLRIADDAIVVDTSDLSFDEVVVRLVEIAQTRSG